MVQSLPVSPHWGEKHVLKNILVFAPHYDDEAIGCGGTIAKHGAAGDEVHVVYMTRGDSTLPRGAEVEQYLALRESEAREAMDVLGVREGIFLGCDDRGLYPERPLLLKLVEIIRRVNPSIAYTPHPNDGDRDHRITTELVREAIWLSSSPYFANHGPRPSGPTKVRFYEVWSPLPAVSILEDITGVADTKRSAIQCYRTQTVHVDYAEATLGLNRYRGMLMGVDRFAEAFSMNHVPWR